MTVKNQDHYSHYLHKYYLQMQTDISRGIDPFLWNRTEEKLIQQILASGRPDREACLMKYMYENMKSQKEKEHNVPAF